ncbi:hypothetical protein HOE31_01950 [bacterium]|jgi:vacuolar iron transporter family protein|nr:hypothetical protein [bacterium]MBT4121694.1 hypothetical protein [bacterium]MBT4495924.1 hypothetical protein [bacterium]MBT4764290.1 hypothetical protein [bacterium]MBT5401660.1 hypothetical protein [bacterium]
MHKPTLKGISFGLTSGVITTLGMMVGLNAGTGSKLVVLGGIITIAVADAFSDALGIHISEEAEGEHSHREVWAATFATFFSKLIFALTFVIPVMLFELKLAIIISIIWGLFILSLISYLMARDKKGNVWKTILEHLSIAVVVIIVTNYVGILISKYFN